MIEGEGKFSGMHLGVTLPNERSSTYTVTFVYPAAEEAAEGGGQAEAAAPVPEMKFISRDGELVLMAANNFDRDYVVDGETITVDEFEREARRAIAASVAGEGAER